ncbi:MAG TPA: hypothetical protein EYM95_23220 [Candidatus Obscuribacterales bacterium]|nr:hypothetical protein [Candidatus Obscuribacterales bacterium]
MENSPTGAILSHWQKMRALERQLTTTAAASEKTITDLSNELQALQRNLATELQRHKQESRLIINLRTAKDIIIQTTFGKKTKR